VQLHAVLHGGVAGLGQASHACFHFECALGSAFVLAPRLLPSNFRALHGRFARALRTLLWSHGLKATFPASRPHLAHSLLKQIFVQQGAMIYFTGPK
jgi:hypothetical protein